MNMYCNKDNAVTCVYLADSTSISTTDTIGTNVFTVLVYDIDDVSFTMTCVPSPCPFTIFACKLFHMIYCFHCFDNLCNSTRMEIISYAKFIIVEDITGFNMFFILLLSMGLYEVTSALSNNIAIIKL
jgi:hypothetical protein